MKMQAKTFMWLFVVCLMGVSSATSQMTDIFNDEIFTSPVLIEMDLKVTGDLTDNGVSTVQIFYLKSAYLSENMWYQESFEETIGENSIPINTKTSWNGSVYKKLINNLEGGVPTIRVTELKPTSIREINPLRFVYGSLDTNYVMLDYNHSGITAQHHYDLKGVTFVNKECDVRMEKNKDTNATHSLSYFNNNSKVATIIYNDYSLIYKDLIFPKSINYIIYKNESDFLMLDYTILSIIDIDIFEFDQFVVENPSGIYSRVSTVFKKTN